ncbi:MAG: hypothetical protein D6702_03025 [Planctomycetota bacterium]|nr:MAG: hypothetical protein D6702_03025 [Planctomycetota bacterium]
MAGMPARRPLGPGRELRRPLLELRRDEIRSWLRAEGIGWQEDPTNDDLRAAARNRLRAEALPALTGVGAGDPVAGLLRLAAEARAWIEAAPAVRERVGDWRELPSALRRLEIAERLREAGETPSPRRLDDLERALLQRGAAGLRPGLGLRLAGGDLVLAERR